MIESLWILIVVGIACSIVGNLLVQKQSVMIADAISHTILLGIVIAFFIVQDLDSPWLIVGATIFGVITVFAIETVVKNTAIQQDAAIGLIFSAFFSTAVILISKYLANVHLDIDMVLLGQVVFAPLNRMTFLGMDLPKAFVQNIFVLVILFLFLSLTYRPLIIRLFDETYARAIGIPVSALDFALMTLVSLTSVVAFQSVGAILVIAMIVAPALVAQLYAKSFMQLLMIGMLVSTINAIGGYYLALYFNVSMSGMVAVVSFITFIIFYVSKTVFKH
ncbi:metal ABC transporter permease [Aerococcaceae bacterium zg-ZJ1578]|uniref:metal ABC transporter permease n=1 Tax=Aerococcaceae TaxID=186827 RepID=UPI0013BE1932|nr:MULTISPECIES: metal ABC transporter permease [unclassified Facklamia]MBK0348123.1 metal ABC transporter permease [Aerococcaceae bacterium zg-1578]NEW64068.1 metal ABC transporter permease [Facklamia sp. 252]NEW67525.1 metal ABC transporter permease [Facklamia sp. 253]QQD65777.1 metal ABC transporter permease [Aerococcaceae bacterium zg-252]